MSLSTFQQIAATDVSSIDTNQQAQLGTVAFDKIGRRYRYVKAGGTTLVVGNLVQNSAVDTQFTDMAVLAAAAGQNKITVTLGSTATTAGLFVDGVLAVTVTPGLGQTFRITSHDVTAGAGNCVFTLEENLTVALTTSSKVTVTASQHSGVIVSGGVAQGSRTGTPVGIAVYPITNACYGWIGVQGEFAVLSDASVGALGDALMASVGTGGAVTKWVTAAQVIGYASRLGISAKAEQATINLP